MLSSFIRNSITNRSFLLSKSTKFQLTLTTNTSIYLICIRFPLVPIILFVSDNNILEPYQRILCQRRPWNRRRRRFPWRRRRLRSCTARLSCTPRREELYSCTGSRWRPGSWSTRYKRSIGSNRFLSCKRIYRTCRRRPGSCTGTIILVVSVKKIFRVKYSLHRRNPHAI